MAMLVSGRVVTNSIQFLNELSFAVICFLLSLGHEKPDVPTTIEIPNSETLVAPYLVQYKECLAKNLTKNMPSIWHRGTTMFEKSYLVVSFSHHM